jgi:hypothetical protein
MEVRARPADRASLIVRTSAVSGRRAVTSLICADREKCPIGEHTRELLTFIEPFPFIGTDHLGNQRRRSQSADWRSEPKNPPRNA